MSWGSSIFVGIITAAVGAIVAGFVATLAVGWYRISGFEAGSAAFVIGFAFLGIVVGFILGIIASRTIGSGADPSFLRALGASQGVLLGIAAIVAVSARLLADVPPTIDGEELMLAVEVRWPAGHTDSPVTLPGEPVVRLGSMTGSNTLRASSRGHGFIIPLSGSPSTKDTTWTEWYPHARPGAPPLPNGFTYRYRVQRRSEPVRTEAFGPFEVSTIASYFFDEEHDGKTRLAAMAEFTVKHRGQPLTIERKASGISTNGASAFSTET